MFSKEVEGQLGKGVGEGVNGVWLLFVIKESGSA
jgi:hypothetical protein